MPSLLLFETQELRVLTMILLMFYFMVQFHIADILGKELQGEKRELERSLSLLKLVLITRVSQHLVFWIWWLRAHQSKDWRAEEINRLSYAAPCPLVYTFICFLHWATWCKHSYWHIECRPLVGLGFFGSWKFWNGFSLSSCPSSALHCNKVIRPTT